MIYIMGAGKVELARSTELHRELQRCRLFAVSLHTTLLRDIQPFSKPRFLAIIQVHTP